MQKSDLKNGMIVEISNGDRFIVIDNFILGNTWNNLNSYNEDLTEKCIDKCDIVKVYEVTCGRTLDNILKPNESFGVKLIWEREEIDWSKIPFGTRIRVWDNSDEKFEARFMTYVEGNGKHYRVWLEEAKHPWDFKHCELVEEPKEEKEVTYEEIAGEYNKYCHSKEPICEECNYTETEDCAIAYVVDNFNVTRK